MHASLPSLDTDATQAAQSSRRLASAALVLALLACGLTAYWLWVLRDHRLDFTDRQIRLQTAAVAEHTRSIFDAADAALQTVSDDLRSDHVDAAEASAVLRARLGRAPHLLALRLFDSDGRLLASSGDDAAASVRAPPAAPDATLQVRPALADPRDGHPAVDLVRAVPGAPHRAAQAVARVDARFVTAFFAHVAYAKDAHVGLFASDGTLLAGDLDPVALAAPGTPPAEALQRLLDAGKNASTAHGEVFAAAQPLKGLPLVVVTLRARAAVLAPWREYVLNAVIVTAFALAVLALIVRRLQREIGGRVQAQATLERTRAELQARLQRTRRLESLGRLSGGIAHDFNNILAVILGFGDLLQQSAPPGSAQARQVDQVLRAGERGKRLVGRILSFSRGSARAPAPLCVDEVVGEATDLLAATAPVSVRLELALGAPGALVLGDATLLFESLGNLCTNAIHAMPQGGTLRVRTSTLHTAHEQSLSHGVLTPGDWVVIHLDDDGQGMAHDVLEHLFEPFFTTRAAQGGTGLGLAMVHGAVSEMNGVIDVQSSPGGGARFGLHFPLATSVAALAAAPTPSAPRGHGQVVMIVDDEPALVAMTEEVVAGLGYEPVGFVDARLALAALQATPERFDAVLTDQVMPHLPGTELAQRLRALRPRMPILLASGFVGQGLDRLARDAGVTVLLQKPLHRAELAEHLARLLAPA